VVADPRRALVTALLLTLGGALTAGTGPQGPAPPRLGATDRVRLVEAFAVIAAVQEKVWPRWSEAPSSLVFVDRDFEYLLGSRERPEGFARSEEDPRLGAAVLVRPRTFSRELLATILPTFPAFRPTSTCPSSSGRRTSRATRS